MDKWIPHDLTERNKLDRLNVCSSLLTRFNRDPFFDRIITCDERWVLYDNRKWCAWWLDRDEACAHTPRPSLYPRKILITVWWNVPGHLPYLLDLSPIDFHLFKHLELFIRAKQYENKNSLKNAISEFIDSKDQNFFKTGIYALKSRWEKSIEVNGAYFE
ncbi:histone-lysine N-methyltransferase SETMAR-like [Vespa mandarinia]|uniref:histone-lysine N-methyltransferase SETMAR-like n=1 Tax=Vespa mandarinia TaxID=7446 RepID=UPI00160BA7A2|nr:histone-lysine N-methyltransferase SETMAR-like [Vespa mandarinia]